MSRRFRTSNHEDNNLTGTPHLRLTTRNAARRSVALAQRVTAPTAGEDLAQAGMDGIQLYGSPAPMPVGPPQAAAPIANAGGDIWTADQASEDVEKKDYAGQIVVGVLIIIIAAVILSE